jgi:D-hydroxyproline dehydrogenase subunit gamma
MRRLDDYPTAEAVELSFDGAPVLAQLGESVAAALLVSGVSSFRTTPKTGALRAPFCMMGACFDCLVMIDGVPNRQACMTEVRNGMKVESMRGAAQSEERIDD